MKLSGQSYHLGCLGLTAGIVMQLTSADRCVILVEKIVKIS